MDKSTAEDAVPELCAVGSSPLQETPQGDSPDLTDQTNFLPTRQVSITS